MNGRKNIYIVDGVEYSSNGICVLYNVTRNMIEWARRKYSLGFLEAAEKIGEKPRVKTDTLIKQIISKAVADEDRIKETISVCSVFGCPEILTLTEMLCGSKCLKHQ